MPLPAAASPSRSPPQAASNRALTAEDVVAAVGQLGDNSLAPAGVDVSGLALEQGGGGEVGALVNGPA
jgi:hypothetical protein